jgi:hypothetical protein
MAATKRQLNWKPVTFLPSGGSIVTFSGITQVQVDPGGTLLMFSGDNDRFPTLIVVPVENPSIVITGADYANFMAQSPGTVGTVSATHLDAIAATNGNIVFTMINAVVENVPGGGSCGQFGEGTFSAKGFSSDGFTNPLVFARS